MAEPLLSDGTPWNGDYLAKERKPKPSSGLFLAEIAGDAFGVDDGTLLPVGSVLELVDLAAGRCAHRYMEGVVATVSVDKGELLSPVRSGELVRCKARVVCVGSSSITVEIETEKEILAGGLASKGRPCFENCFAAQLTFVAIDSNKKRPYKNVPKLVDPGNPQVASHAAEVLAEKTAVRAIDAAVAKVDAESDESVLRAMSLDVDEYGSTRLSRVNIDNTLVELRKQYLPRHENFGGIVFGGDLLMLLERAALYCGRRFCGNDNISCVRMHSIHFRLPIEPTFLLVTRARVVHIGKYVMDVEVVVSIDRTHEGLGMQVSHTGYFSVVSRDKAGVALPVAVGLDIAASSVDGLRAYNKARLRRKHVVGVEDEGRFVTMFA